jgi:hypothetical protein
MTLEAIKAAITELPEKEKTTLVSWLNTQDSVAWDRQMEADFSDGGPGVSLLEAWDAEIAAGESIPLEQFLAERNVTNKSK